MDITLEEFYKLPIYNVFFRILFHDVMIFDQDSNSDLLDSYIMPVFGKHKIDNIECSNGSIYYDGVILQIKLKG